MQSYHSPSTSQTVTLGGRSAEESSQFLKLVRSVLFGRCACPFTNNPQGMFTCSQKHQFPQKVNEDGLSTCTKAPFASSLTLSKQLYCASTVPFAQLLNGELGIQPYLEMLNTMLREIEDQEIAKKFDICKKTEDAAFDVLASMLVSLPPPAAPTESCTGYAARYLEDTIHHLRYTYRVCIARSSRIKRLASALAICKWLNLRITKQTEKSLRVLVVFATEHYASLTVSQNTSIKTLAQLERLFELTGPYIFTPGCHTREFFSTMTQHLTGSSAPVFYRQVIEHIPKAGFKAFHEATVVDCIYHETACDPPRARGPNHLQDMASCYYLLICQLLRKLSVLNTILEAVPLLMRLYHCLEVNNSAVKQSLMQFHSPGGAFQSADLPDFPEKAREALFAFFKKQPYIVDSVSMLGVLPYAEGEEWDQSFIARLRGSLKHCEQVQSFFTEDLGFNLSSPPSRMEDTIAFTFTRDVMHSIGRQISLHGLCPETIPEAIKTMTQILTVTQRYMTGRLGATYVRCMIALACWCLETPERIPEETKAVFLHFVREKHRINGRYIGPIFGDKYPQSDKASIITSAMRIRSTSRLLSDACSFIQGCMKKCGIKAPAASAMRTASAPY